MEPEFVANQNQRAPIIYPQLGSEIEYVRYVHNRAEFETGKGKVIGIGLDHAKRPVLLVQGIAQDETGSPKFNVDMACVNPSLEFIEKYKLTLEFIQNLSKEGNEKSAKIVEEYNARVDDAFNSILGNPINTLDS